MRSLLFLVIISFLISCTSAPKSSEKDLIQQQINETEERLFSLQSELCLEKEKTSSYQKREIDVLAKIDSIRFLKGILKNQ